MHLQFNLNPMQMMRAIMLITCIVLYCSSFQPIISTPT